MITSVLKTIQIWPLAVLQPHNLNAHSITDAKALKIAVKIMDTTGARTFISIMVLEDVLKMKDNAVKKSNSDFPLNITLNTTLPYVAIYFTQMLLDQEDKIMHSLKDNQKSAALTNQEITKMEHLFLSVVKEKE